MLPEGKWSDLDYACFFRTNWEPVEHLKRLVTIAASYTDKQSRYYGSEVLYNAIRDALRHWGKIRFPVSTGGITRFPFRKHKPRSLL